MIYNTQRDLTIEVYIYMYNRERPYYRGVYLYNRERGLTIEVYKCVTEIPYYRP